MWITIRELLCESTLKAEDWTQHRVEYTKIQCTWDTHKRNIGLHFCCLFFFLVLSIFFVIWIFWNFCYYYCDPHELLLWLSTLDCHIGVNFLGGCPYNLCPPLRTRTSAARWHLWCILKFFSIAILENLEIFPTIWVSFCKKRQNKCDGVHYIISSALCNIHLVKIFIF